MNPHQIIRSLKKLEFRNTFNPYSDHCSDDDRADAADLRCESLQTILKAATELGVDSLWIGRDLGYRGGRRTGLAFTDDVHLSDHGRRWNVEVCKPTEGKVVAERTAAVIWKALNQIAADVRIFLWNVFPLHPHEPRRKFTNRAHNASEREAGKDLLKELIEMLNPSRLVAIGNDAKRITDQLAGDQRVIKVRHPSYGGQKQFFEQIGNLYDLQDYGHSADVYQAELGDVAVGGPQMEFFQR